MSATIRRWPMVALGIFDLLLGLLALLFTLMMVLAASKMPVTAGQPNPYLGAAVFAALGLAGLSLGWGLALCRRWARALGSVAGKAGLVVGALAMAFIVLNADKLLALMRAPFEAKGQIMPLFVAFIPLAALVFVYLILPGLHALILGRDRAVQACKKHDPTPRWTDRHPEPILLLLLLHSVGLLGCVMVLAQGYPSPFFGLILGGWAGQALALLLAGFFGWLLWATWRHRTAAWKAALAYCGLQVLSSAITFSFHTMEDFYRAMENGEALLTAYQASGLQGNSFAAYMVAAIAVYAGYIWWCRPYFKRR